MKNIRITDGSLLFKKAPLLVFTVRNNVNIAEIITITITAFKTHAPQFNEFLRPAIFINSWKKFNILHYKKKSY